LYLIVISDDKHYRGKVIVEKMAKFKFVFDA